MKLDRAFRVIERYVPFVSLSEDKTVPSRITKYLNQIFISDATDYRKYCETFAELLNLSFPTKAFVIITDRDITDRLYIKRIMIGNKVVR